MWDMSIPSITINRTNDDEHNEHSPCVVAYFLADSELLYLLL